MKNEIFKKKVQEQLIILLSAGKLERYDYYLQWQTKRGNFTLLGDISVFLEKQKEKGYDLNDISATCRERSYWGLKNRLSGETTLSMKIDFPIILSLSKDELLEFQEFYSKFVLENRERYLGKKQAAIEFIKERLFYRNNLEKMVMDKETHDYILSIKEQEDFKKQQEHESAVNSLRLWSLLNGSELLKLRIKHEQNWQYLAEGEWAIAHSVGFHAWDIEDYDDRWPVNNATLEQLRLLEHSQEENPKHEIETHRFKFNVGYDYPYHRTFLTCAVLTPLNNIITLFKEIDDVDDEDDQ